MHLTPAEARALLISRQLLDGQARLPAGKEGAARIIERLGYLQIDTIAVIERAHHHTLWTRQPGYHPAMLHELQARDRRVFEYLGHAMCFLPMRDYRFSLPRMRRFPRPGSWEEGWFHKVSARDAQAMLDRIRAEGPLASRDFAAPAGKRRGPWWDWKPAKLALELLFWRGDLMVSERKNFQRVYDLTERVLPGWVETRLPDAAECGRFLVRKALGALGVATESEIVDYLHVADRSTVRRELKEMIAAGEALGIKVGKLEAGYHALPEVLAQKRKKPRPFVRLLSPFDNLAIHRPRLQSLFDFDYRLECYTPAPRRAHGYFSLPILWNDRLIGRLDPKAERKKRRLLIRTLKFEEGFRAFDAVLPLLAARCRELAAFNGCDEVKIERTVPAKILKLVQRT